MTMSADNAEHQKYKLPQPSMSNAQNPVTTTMLPPVRRAIEPGRSEEAAHKVDNKFLSKTYGLHSHRNGVGAALSDTPATTAPSSPNIHPQRQNSSDRVYRSRPTTLDIPGLTRSRVSPDGRIAQRDIGSKLVIVMVGLPARGKSYITKKMARYLNWLQHDTKIFNVGERRRVVANGSSPSSALTEKTHSTVPGASAGTLVEDMAGSRADTSRIAAKILINDANPDASFSTGELAPVTPSKKNGGSSGLLLPASASGEEKSAEIMDQSADFFDPQNKRAASIREQCAMDTLDELLDYILDKGGSVGILDATNSTIQRRELIIKKIRARAGPDLNVLFLESVCMDEGLLERNMRLKLSGPDYKGKDAGTSLADFKRRVAIYEKSYVPLGEWEEKNNMPFVQMIDVGRKVISHQIKGFLSAQAVYYLLNFNLAPRQIWLTRHGQSVDNELGRIGGDAALSPFGVKYARALSDFICHERKAWEVRQIDKEQSVHFPPQPGDATPPNPHYSRSGETSHIAQQSFCVWTSMLKRSINTAQFFDEEDFDVKQMRMLDELNGGLMEGMTYEEIRQHHRDQYDMRRADKIGYRYPGPGGESYLDIINRLRPVIVELERMTDHVLIISHRAIIRVLVAYFQGLATEEVATLNVPLGLLYCLEPKPYGVDFKVYKFNPDKGEGWFDYDPTYQLHRAPIDGDFE